MNNLRLTFCFCAISSSFQLGLAQQNSTTFSKQKDTSIDSLVEKHSTLLSKEENPTNESTKINTKAVYEKQNYGKEMQVIEEDKNPTNRK